MNSAELEVVLELISGGIGERASAPVSRQDGSTRTRQALCANVRALPIAYT